MDRMADRKATGCKPAFLPLRKIQNPKSKINRANRGVRVSAVAKASGFALQASIFAFGYAVTSRRDKTVRQEDSQVSNLLGRLCVKGVGAGI